MGEIRPIWSPWRKPGLPDGLFSKQKSQFGKILEVIRFENVYIFYGRLEYFMDICNILHMTIWYILY
jgi:hypothetical protein